MTSPQYVFGPVPSRRLGRSLGVDLVPFKTCSHDCVYCQLGRTTNNTGIRANFALAEAVIDQVREVLASGDRPDSITLAGSGEPTLHTQIGEIIAAIKDLTDVPVTILTNGSLFCLAEVRQACAGADRVVPSLDAGTEEAFQRINRPAQGLTLSGHVEGLEAFRREYTGQLWLEMMIVAGMNDTEDELAAMVSHVNRIGPDRVQLNTVIRPPADADARAVTPERMDEIAALFGERAEVIADFTSRHLTGGELRRSDDLVEMVHRRPCTVDDIAAGLNAHRNEVIKHIEVLVAEGRIRPIEQGDRVYYGAPAESQSDE